MAADAKEEALDVSVERAFPELSFERPIVVTHANDGSDRVFVAEQEGIIKVFPNDQDIEEADVFLDIEDQVVYRDSKNEEGLLGFAFHPKYKTNGHFFVYYTTADADLTSVVTRFTVSKDDPGKADPQSEVELLRVKQPYWNHNGGTLAFGPDGMLYVALGDGGNGGDPHRNGQNLTTLLGSILRIDVDHQDDGKNYAIPKDNPFVGKTIVSGRAKDKEVAVAPEIYAYGFRNVWRLSFDQKTGSLWAADVGQGLWEEINIVQSGGNYGWNMREAQHWFRPDGNDTQEGLIDPIWEYHHDIGKSITGGSVYRGRRVPELVGKYVYADYVSGLLWALDYNAASGSVQGNYSITGKNQPIMSFGEDQSGEIYFTTPFGQLFQFKSGQ
jgi:quinoprotein glucose dehydrogenase